MRTWLRRSHRWLGLLAVLFVMLLSVTGIALNHSGDWKLDRHYVQWDWAISGMGIRAPEPSATFADRGHRVTRLGEKAYVDAIELPYPVESLAGLVVIEPLMVVATSDTIHLLTVDGEFVQRIDLSAELPASVERIGRVDGRPVLQAKSELFIGDADVTAFVPWADADANLVNWSTASDLTDVELANLQELYRGRSLTVERLLIEIHSGRILAAAGPLLLDLVGLVLIVLGISGLFVWRQGSHRSRVSR